MEKEYNNTPDNKDSDRDTNKKEIGESITRKIIKSIRIITRNYTEIACLKLEK
jgi:hypothetical protein